MTTSWVASRQEWRYIWECPSEICPTVIVANDAQQFEDFIEDHEFTWHRIPAREVSA